MGGSGSDTLTHRFPGWIVGKIIILGVETCHPASSQLF